MSALTSPNPIFANLRQVPLPDPQPDGHEEPGIVERPAGWSLAAFAGRLSEISQESAGASLTLIFRLVLEAQQRTEPAAWITSRDSIFFPPDAADSGIDLGTLAVIRVRDALATARAAEHLLRSSAFGLLVLDLGSNARLPLSAQARLAGQARRHGSALVFLTQKHKTHASLSSLVSLRAHASAIQRHGRYFRCQVSILKDKHRGPGRSHEEVYRGPHGLH